MNKLTLCVFFNCRLRRLPGRVPEPGEPSGGAAVEQPATRVPVGIPPGGAVHARGVHGGGSIPRPPAAGEAAPCRCHQVRLPAGTQLET